VDPVPDPLLLRKSDIAGNQLVGSPSTNHNFPYCCVYAILWRCVLLCVETFVDFSFPSIEPICHNTKTVKIMVIVLCGV
jgi:hypothetical protein